MLEGLTGENLEVYEGLKKKTKLTDEKILKIAGGDKNNIAQTYYEDKYCPHCEDHESCQSRKEALNESLALLKEIRVKMDQRMNMPMGIIEMLGMHPVMPIGRTTMIGIPKFLEDEIPPEVMDYLANTDVADIEMIVIEGGKATVHKKDGTTMAIPPASNDEPKPNQQ